MLKSVLFTQCHQGLNLLSLLSISQYIQCTCWHGASLEAQRSDTPGHTNTIYGDKIVQSGCVLVWAPSQMLKTCAEISRAGYSSQIWLPTKLDRVGFFVITYAALLLGEECSGGRGTPPKQRIVPHHDFWEQVDSYQEFFPKKQLFVCKLWMCIKENSDVRKEMQCKRELLQQ